MTRLVSFVTAHGPAVGRVEGDDVVVLAGAGEAPTTVGALLARGTLDALIAGVGNGQRHALADIEFLPAVVDPPRIFCIGVNYEEHRLETGRERATAPTVFMRTAQSQVGHDRTIRVAPETSIKVDYEGEIAIVIGTGGRNIARDDATRHVAYYSAYNDVSVRDWQNHTSQFTPGKNFDATGAFGPWLVPASDMPENPADIALTTRLNGQVMQSATAAQMIFPIDEQIAYISTFTALLPGDVIVTGTPGGVGAKRTPPLWLKSGDVVEIEVSGIGILRNRIG